MNYFPVLGVFIIFIYIQKQYIHDLPTISLSKNSAILAKGFCFCSFCSGKTTTWVEFISRFRPYCRSVFLVLDSACQSIPISLCSLLFQNYRANFTHFEQKNTHISGCKNVSNRVYIFMSYSTHVYLHGYCSSFIIILLISSLSDSHLNYLSFHHSSLLQSRSASPSSSKSQASKTKATIAWRRSRAPQTEFDRQVWAASELGTPISLFDPTIRLETETMTKN